MKRVLGNLVLLQLVSIAYAFEWPTAVEWWPPKEGTGTPDTEYSHSSQDETPYYPGKYIQASLRQERQYELPVQEATTDVLQAKAKSMQYLNDANEFERTVDTIRDLIEYCKEERTREFQDQYYIQIERGGNSMRHQQGILLKSLEQVGESVRRRNSYQYEAVPFLSGINQAVTQSEIMRIADMDTHIFEVTSSVQQTLEYEIQRWQNEVEADQVMEGIPLQDVLLEEETKSESGHNADLRKEILATLKNLQPQLLSLIGSE